VYKIRVASRGDDYMAWIDGNTARWECSPTIESAIDRLAMSHKEMVGAEVIFNHNWWPLRKVLDKKPS
jgi:hypothetical protein